MCSTVVLLWATSPQGVWRTSFRGLGVVRCRPQGAHLHRLHDLQLETWGVWSVSGHPLQSSWLGSQLGSGVSGAASLTRPGRPWRFVFSFAIVIALDLLSSLVVILLSPVAPWMKYMDSPEFRAETEFSVYLLLWYGPHIISSISQNRHCQKWVNDGPFHAKWW